METTKKRHIKRRNITSRSCLVCTSPYDGAFNKDTYNEKDEETVLSILLHKTRRQTHSLCVECFRHYVLEELKKNEKERRFHFFIQCPGNMNGLIRNQCKHEINIISMDKILRTFSDINDQVGRLYILSNKGSSYCPSKQCGNIVIVPDGTNECECHECSSTWCFLCNISPYHSNLTCGQYRINQDNSTEGQKIKELINEGKIKLCPKCNHGTMKNEGCNKITCIVCNSHFCWLCGIGIEGYDHFRTGKCSDRLFDD